MTSFDLPDLSTLLDRPIDGTTRLRNGRVEACQAPEKACADRIQWDVMGTSRVWIVDPLDVPAGTGSTPRLGDGAAAAGDPGRSRQATVLIAARPRHPLRR